jgi:hypothetical protein
MSETSTEKYQRLKMELFGHDGIISGDEWNRLIKHKYLIDMKLIEIEELCSTYLESLIEHYNLNVKNSPEVKKHVGMWIYLVDYSTENFSFYETKYEAFDAGCDVCRLPPVVHVAQIETDNDNEKN